MSEERTENIIKKETTTMGREITEKRRRKGEGVARENKTRLARELEKRQRGERGG